MSFDRGPLAPTAEWNRPAPAYIPPNSYWPFLLAVGITLFVWAPALDYVIPWVVAPVGLAMMVITIRGWLREIRDDWRKQR